jgi:predicted nuclease of predicted toxin-antitoxin system
MLRYYFDEHVKSAIPEQFQRRGVDVLTAQAAGRAGKEIPDEDQLDYATSLGRVLVTEDRDFINLALWHLPHAGVVLLQRVVSIGEYVEFLEVLALTTDPDQMQNDLQYYDW